MDNFSGLGWFQVWDFNVSHDQLLIRCAKDKDQSENVDLIFGGVFYMEIPCDLTGVRLDKPSADEITYLVGRTGIIDGLPRRYFVLCTAERRYFVGALLLKVKKNTLDYGESSLE